MAVASLPPPGSSFNEKMLYSGSSGSLLYLGFLSAFGTITREAFTFPTRSRAMARTSVGALNVGFFRLAIYETRA